MFMLRAVIGWVIYGGCHCRRAKNFQVSNPGRWIYVAVKAGFYRTAVEVIWYIPRLCDSSANNIIM